jgi:hypothetical protein
MLVALERFHAIDWSEKLAGEWRSAIDTAAEAMFDGYHQRFEL